jgi:hypothetical protein
MRDLPYLTGDTCEVTSKASRQYNCIAWAAGENTDWWWPDPMGVGRWPASAPRVVSVDAFVQAYETLGYKLCYDNSLETGLEKVAIFGKTNPADGSVIPTHAALQLKSGEWTSKLGALEDICHKTLEAAEGPLYGKALYYMSRPRS